LDYVKVKAKASGRRSIVTMSLGGPCETPDCTKDSLVRAVESLSAANILVSVAAGNEGCNACSGSPNAAPSAINVGASDMHDQVPYFSNFGQCIDAYAPGYEIVSACANKVCNNEKSYWPLSGTSMACPHVTGVIAQLLEKNPTATPDQVRKC
jgi:subtilisin family serine protease